MKAWWMGSSTSAQILTCRGNSMKQSRVWLTMPSVEFSTGTTPKWAPPLSTSRNTSSMAGRGRVWAKWPNCASAAISV